ncbi:hypothetical protein F4781DRAFT_128571 [Annulohypoxylon bovei var. microspora]|nr:hypothetical protein F4781DRAFT_128571 [Annulohypoxylon bovei var. microspora]
MASTTNEAPSAIVEDPVSGAVPAPSTEMAASPSGPSGPPSTTAPLAGTPPTAAANAPSPAAAAAPPARTGTPLRSTANGQQQQQQDAGGNASTSRAASQHPDAGFAMPAEAPPHGGPARQYLNSRVTGPLLDGMKILAKEKPKDPLRVLGEYLLQRSKELETPSTSA